MKSHVCLLLILVATLGSQAIAGESVAVEYYPAGTDTERKLPFSDAVKVGNLLILSGKIGNIPGTLDLAPGGIQGETRQTLENIKTSLENHGSSMSEVVKCTVFLADIAEWAAMNEIYVEYFPDKPPARSALGVSGLALGARTEIECMATVGL